MGDRACVAGKALEFDLLTLGAGASVGRLCDATCHTVENFVIKLAPVAIGDRADVGARSVVMPGGALGAGATLLPHALILKGEAAADGTVWAGLPAEAVDASALDDVDANLEADGGAEAPLLVAADGAAAMV